MAARPTTEATKELTPGTRVRLTSAGIGVTLRSPYGTIVGPDRWLDYYIIRLDEPAIFAEFEGEQEELLEISEFPGNFDIHPSV
jgi:hypothetical protein